MRCCRLFRHEGTLESDLRSQTSIARTLAGKVHLVRRDGSARRQRSTIVTIAGLKRRVWQRVFEKVAAAGPVPDGTQYRSITPPNIAPKRHRTPVVRAENLVTRRHPIQSPRSKLSLRPPCRRMGQRPDARAIVSGAVSENLSTDVGDRESFGRSARGCST
jgi:hypothetical protein